jgi:hypothetical protein
MESKMSKPEWEQAFEDWQVLLKRANATELLNDPLAIWDEAWRQAAMVTIGILMAQSKMVTDTEQMITHIQKRLLK